MDETYDRRVPSSRPGGSGSTQQGTSSSHTQTTSRGTRSSTRQTYDSIIEFEPTSGPTTNAALDATHSATTTADSSRNAAPTVDHFAGLTLRDLSDPMPGRKPEYTMHVLAQVAIQSSPRRPLRQSEIRDAIIDRFPWFATAGVTWRNTLRHALTNRASFYRVPKPPNVPGRGNYWTYRYTPEPPRKRKLAKGKQRARGTRREADYDDEEEYEDETYEPRRSNGRVARDAPNTRAEQVMPNSPTPPADRPTALQQPTLSSSTSLLPPPLQAEITSQGPSLPNTDAYHVPMGLTSSPTRTRQYAHPATLNRPTGYNYASPSSGPHAQPGHAYADPLAPSGADYGQVSQVYYSSPRSYQAFDTPQPHTQHLQHAHSMSHTHLQPPSHHYTQPSLDFGFFSSASSTQPAEREDAGMQSPFAFSPLDVYSASSLASTSSSFSSGPEYFTPPFSANPAEPGIYDENQNVFSLFSAGTSPQDTLHHHRKWSGP